MPIAISGSGPITGITSLNTTVDSTELGYLDGVTSALQTQINSKGTYTDWTAYTPTIVPQGGGTFTLGNGSMTAEYCRVGNMVTVRLSLTWGSTTSISTSTAWNISMPISSSGSSVGSAWVLDTGSRYYIAVCRLVSGSYVQIYHSGTNNAEVTNVSPMTWASGDGLEFTITYRAA